MRVSILRLCLSAALGIALSAGALQAATSEAPPPSSPNSPESPGSAQPGDEQGGEVSDEKLRQFAAAAQGVQKIQQEYAEKAQSLQETTEAQIVAALEDTGMSVAEFTALVNRVQNDPEMARRLDALQDQ